MLNKRTMKIISIIAIAMMLVVTMSSLVFGVYDVPTGQSSDFSGKVNTIGGMVLGIFQAVGTAVAIIILVWLGVKYVMASPDGKADIKKQAFGYILGAVLIFGAPWIITLVINTVNNLNS